MTKQRRLPGIITIEAFAALAEKPSNELAARRADLGSLMHVYGAAVNKLRVEAEAITTLLHAREKPQLEVSDHAVVRWLEKVKGMDMNALRQEIADAATEAKNEGDGSICRAKGDAVAYTKSGVTFVVARRNIIVTVVFGPYLNPIGK